MFNQTSLVHIPAYDSNNNGLIVSLNLTATSSNTAKFKAYGAVAKALLRNFQRIIEIMSSLKKDWIHFESLSYLLESTSNNFVVKDSKSSSMALCIALININRVVHGQLPLSGLSGTGILRIDGTFDDAHQEKQKYFAASNLQSINKFITPQETKNLFALEHLIENMDFIQTP